MNALGLVLNMVILWTTRYMHAALDYLREIGFDVREEDLEQLSLLVSHHINFVGKHHFSLPEEVKRGSYGRFTILTTRRISSDKLCQCDRKFSDAYDTDPFHNLYPHADSRSYPTSHDSPKPHTCLSLHEPQYQQPTSAIGHVNQIVNHNGIIYITRGWKVTNKMGLSGIRYIYHPDIITC